MAYQFVSGRREEVDVEGKLQLKINRKQWCVFGKHLNCMTRVQPSSCFAFLFVFFFLDRVFLFQTADKGMPNPLKEDWCGGWLAMDLGFHELKNKLETFYGFQPCFKIPVATASAGRCLDTCPQICT